MVTILCVLKSGGVYDETWVTKLFRGVDRHLGVDHRLVCLSDVNLPFGRIPLKHDWPGWWSKVECFRPGVVEGPTIYFDLDTVLTGSIDWLAKQESSFSMLENFNDPSMVGSGVMWFKEKAPEIVYERFIQAPQRIMDHYNNVKVGSYRGDQAWIFDCLDRKVDTISSPALRSYKRHCRNGLPEGTSIVAFHGRPRPSEINAEWLRENWS